jgi:sugar O-acyltransferase (sialic acid O-acetyltransferase NeuD family)
MKDIIIIGAGGFGREVKMLIDDINLIDPSWNFLGYADDSKSVVDLINNSPVLGGIDYLNRITKETYVTVAIGNPVAKTEVLGKLNNSNIRYATLIHPSAVIGKDEVFIGEGSIICAGCLLTVNLYLGKHVILNLGCTVGHDTIIKDYCSFMPSVNISGEVIIEEGVYGGTGAKIINQLNIGAYTTIGAGAVVSKSLPSQCVAVGIPAKVVKFKE